MQKWLPLNYSFVQIQNRISLTNLVLKDEASEAILNMNKIIV